MENNLLEIGENTYVGKVKDVLELLASWTSDVISEVYYSNGDAENLDKTHIHDAYNLLGKMEILIDHCEYNKYDSNKLIAIDLGFDDEGIHWIKTLKEESEY